MVEYKKPVKNDKNKYMKKSNSILDTRLAVLFSSLMIENMLSTFLAGMLDIDRSKIEETYSFSNKSSALSFNAKLNLFIDVGALDKGQRNKFITFMEIRNQFVHNLNAYNYEMCVTRFLPEKKNFLLSLYKPKKKMSIEKHLENSVRVLCADVEKITQGLWAKIAERERNKLESRKNVDKEFFEALLNALEKYEDYPPKNFMNLRKDGTYNKEEVRDIANRYVMKVLYKALHTVQKSRKPNKKNQG
jgi:hypothetical protein